jgi:2-hydroxy-6-oxo-6-(2'-carboxyphenyl)-hexa-2,4-dienoate hydrolase
LRLHHAACGALLCGPLTALGDSDAAPCSIDANQIDRGERLLVRICGDGLAPDARIDGLESAGIELIYRQDLSRCAPDDRRRGLLLELEATAEASTATIRIAGSASNDAACKILLPVPQRELLPAVRLVPLETANLYRLHVAGRPDIDLSGACAAGLFFPAGPGPTISNSGPPPKCGPNHVEATVQLRPGPQRPAKLVLTARDRNGVSVETIGYIDPPAPFFADAMREDDAKYIDVGGVRTRYFEKGSGEVLVLVHGGQPSAPDFNAWEWQQNFDGLARDFRVIAVDRIGQGGTDNPPTLDEYASYYPLVVEHLLGFLDALGIDEAHLVGHSQGGWPVTRIALDHPDRVRSLVIVDSTMIAKSANVAEAVRFYLYQQNNLHPKSGPTVQSIRRGMEFFSYTNNFITDQRVERIHAISQTDKFRQARDWFATTRMSPAHPSFRKLKDEIWIELMDGKLQIPTLIVWGREDPEGSFPAGVAMFEALRDAGSPVRFQALEAAGHVGYMEYPDEFNALVSDFCLSR